MMELWIYEFVNPYKKKQFEQLKKPNELLSSEGQLC